MDVDSMVTARMLDEKKRKGAASLREGLSALLKRDQPFSCTTKMIGEGEAGFFEPIRAVSAMRRSGPLLRFSSIILEARFPSFLTI